MPSYDSRQWSGHLFELKRSMVPEILGRTKIFVAWSCVVYLIETFAPGYLHWFSIPPTVHALFGTALGFLLVFRTNSSNERFWEGRKQWGCIVNECRNLGRLSGAWLSADQSLFREVITWTIAFPYAVMKRLRSAKESGIDGDGLNATDVARVNSSAHVPLAVLRVITKRVSEARERGLIDGFQLRSLDQNVQLLLDYCGACERIRSTPLPFAYTVHLRRVLIIYSLTLPLALIREFDWATIPTTLIVAYSLFGVEEIGVDIENPFELTTNDLPLETYCDGIRSVLSEIRDDPC